MTSIPSSDPAGQARRVGIILQELDSLPTLSSVAVRLLELTTDSEADMKEVIGLVSSDPALAARVLAICNCHESGRANPVKTVDRAVVLLGFEAVRNAVLAVQVFDVLDSMETPLGESSQDKPVFDREAFWLHSLAVAVVAEKIAGVAGSARDIGKGEAFMAGLLHDLGQLVLHVLLPESFDRVCSITETHSASLDRACRQLIGIDTHTTGKRLAEHWRLPPSLVDVIWLNGQRFEALPDVPHRTLIAVVTLADAVVRSRYITPSAHWARAEDIDTLLLPIGITHEDLDAAVADLHESVATRAEALGVNVTHDPAILLRAISRANRSLARTNGGMRQRERLARRQGQILEAIESFHQQLDPGAPVLEALVAINRSLRESFEKSLHAALYHAGDEDGWHLARFGPTGRPISVRSAVAPEGAVSLDAIVEDIEAPTRVRTIAPWLAEHLGDLEGGTLFLAPLRGGADAGAILIYEHDDEDQSLLESAGALVPVWQAALATGAEHEAAANLTEQLARANRDLADMQRQLARNQTMATLGEVAAGAAHEMNNPLTVISGRSQLLATRVGEPDLCRAAGEISAQAERLSEMITALRSFAEPVEVSRSRVDIADLIVRVVQRAGQDKTRQPRINTVFSDNLPPANIDPALVGDALAELVRNAVESKGARHIELRVQTDPLDGRLKVEVRDDGAGLTEHTLRHAFDPFYSEKPAGRQPGLGLARAVRWIDAHGGTITLVNGPKGGAIATIWIPAWRFDEQEAAAAA